MDIMKYFVTETTKKNVLNYLLIFYVLNIFIFFSYEYDEAVMLFDTVKVCH